MPAGLLRVLEFYTKEPITHLPTSKMACWDYPLEVLYGSVQRLNHPCHSTSHWACETHVLLLPEL